MSVLSLERYRDGVLAQDRVLLAQAITLIESTKPEHRELADTLLQELMPHTGGAHRIGITGVPGVGKSTLIDSFGSLLVSLDHKVCVLAVDPSSRRTGGSILGDKTRMPRLATHQSAYIRPSPSSGTLGGVTLRTRETMLLCEAAGFDVVLVETVGAGQSEIQVASMVDVFCVLMLPGAGDDLQGIKKGVLEIADVIAVNKADGEREGLAREAIADLRAALRILTPQSADWQVPVLAISGLEETGLEELWAELVRHKETVTASGEWDDRRKRQQLEWMWTLIDASLRDLLRQGNANHLEELERKVLDGTLSANSAARQALAHLT